MKGSEQILQALNDRLAEELTAINQLLFHSKLCENWGYERLHSGIRAQAMDEMNHAEWLIERIIVLEGIPSVLRLNSIKVGGSVEEMIDIDRTDGSRELPDEPSQRVRTAAQRAAHGPSGSIALPHRRIPRIEQRVVLELVDQHLCDRGTNGRAAEAAPEPPVVVSDLFADVGGAVEHDGALFGAVVQPRVHPAQA